MQLTDLRLATCNMIRAFIANCNIRLGGYFRSSHGLWTLASLARRTVAIKYCPCNENLLGVLRVRKSVYALSL
jgi:hypothetical protein